MTYARITTVNRGQDVKRHSRAGRRGAGSSGVRGFTLIELMIVVGIVAVLVAIAYPMYGDAVRKGKRGQAKADMVELAQRAERFRTVRGTYEGFWATVDTADRESPRAGEGSKAYDITEVETGTTFTLTATPSGGQTADTRCMTLTLNQSGQKGVTGGATGTIADCW